MTRIGPDTRTRLEPGDLKGLSFHGGPSSVTVTDEATGETVAVEASRGSFDIPCAGAPRLLDVSWEASGVRVAAELDVVAAMPCTLDDIYAYRAEQYGFRERYGDDDVARARAKAIEVIEAECRRHVQPVMRTGWVDRPTCTTRTMLMGEDGCEADLISVARAVSASGDELALRPVRKGSPYIDVSAMRYGDAAEVAYVAGMSPVPSEVRPAVVSLAASYLAPKTAPENATSTSTEAGVLSFVIGGVNGATSIPEVNALISRHGRASYMVG